MTYALWIVQRMLAALFLSVIIMIGAIAVRLRGGDLVAAMISLVVGVLAAFVAYGRWRLAPHRRA